MRPFPEATDLALAIKRHRTDWESDQQLADAVRHLEADIDLQAKILTDTKHPVRAIKLQASEDYLPPIPGELVHELMTKTPFRSGARQNVARYRLLRTGQCGHAGRLSRNIHRKRWRFVCDLPPHNARPGENVRWSARLVWQRPRVGRGLLWYPTLPQAISRNGDYVTPRIPSIPGFLEPLQPRKHSRETYQVIKRGSGDRPPRPTPYRGYGY